VIPSFYNRNKIKIITLAPIILGLGFFIYCALFGLFRIYNTKIPEDFSKVNLKLDNYVIQEIDRITNKPKWTLNSSHAEATSDETKAKIINPELKYFGDEKGFTISSAYAILDKSSQAVELVKDARLDTNNQKIKIQAGKILFSEASLVIGFQDSWRLNTDSGYEIIGAEGSITKDFKTIISKTNSTLNSARDGIKLSADLITVNSEADLSIIAEGSAKLDLKNNQELRAEKIEIYKNGKIKALNNVRVIGTDINCTATRLDVTPHTNKKPKIGIFTGNPSATQKGNTIFADIIRYDFDSSLVSFEGNVHS
jgi:lipopolysaccharide assembly outer membrane protein LptD (OstA)